MALVDVTLGSIGTSMRGEHCFIELDVYGNDELDHVLVGADAPLPPPPPPATFPLRVAMPAL